MANVIVVRRPKKVKINRNSRGDGTIKIDSETTDLLEKLMEEADGAISVKELASAMIKYAANDTVIRVEEELEDDE